MHQSHHLQDYPKYDKSLVDEKVEQRMDLVRDVCSLGRFAREEVNIKVRQPISKVYLQENNKEIIGDLLPIIMEELNVKNVEFKSDMSEYLEYNIKPNFKELGKVLGPKIKTLQEKLSKFTKEEIEKVKAKEITINLDGEEFTLTSDMVLITLQQKEGFTAATNESTCVVLDTTLTEELILEGLAREMVRTVQAERKEQDLIITEHIKVYYNGEKDIDKMLELYSDYVKNETLADSIEKDEKLEITDNLNDVKCSTRIERLK